MPPCPTSGTVEGGEGVGEGGVVVVVVTGEEAKEQEEEEKVKDEEEDDVEEDEGVDGKNKGGSIDVVP